MGLLPEILSQFDSGNNFNEQIDESLWEIGNLWGVDCRRMSDSLAKSKIWWVWSHHQPCAFGKPDKLWDMGRRP